MKKIKVDLINNAPYTHTFLLEDDTYSDKRNVYLVDKIAFEMIIKTQGQGYVIREYPDWDKNYQVRMIEEYRPSQKSAIPLMPRMAVHKDTVNVPRGLFETILKKPIKTETKFLVNFGNGRHRFNYLRHFGATAIPFQLSEESAKNLNELVGHNVCKLIK
ncbi:TPA: hypothetical protein ACN32D_004195 [Vibrio parahaemolyticus]|uniref:plasmid fertility inhibition factor family protein n=1 Tax=Vibrio parahaemolyticus TaxID=670 RepID=UPI00046FE88F|nr:hypothetical protein [Vibrio parahaemolyticus]EGQ7914912.1 hypothetical protein [Vibrio parahaemolyticus]EGQ9864792.1 hypothetical protein [Vibrio parahaemolyticus]EGW0146713.1 hypothetical protein [Vibrio parahaemolyticus]EHB9912166.1 hypothetical protein [Vibrio parahaemolyticus]EHY8552852.1 hypothetical protein [Vibrio parahaemolyticus]